MKIQIFNGDWIETKNINTIFVSENRVQCYLGDNPNLISIFFLSPEMENIEKATKLMGKIAEYINRCECFELMIQGGLFHGTPEDYIEFATGLTKFTEGK